MLSASLSEPSLMSLFVSFVSFVSLRETWVYFYIPASGKGRARIRREHTQHRGYTFIYPHPRRNNHSTHGYTFIYPQTNVGTPSASRVYFYIPTTIGRIPICGALLGSNVEKRGRGHLHWPKSLLVRLSACSKVVVCSAHLSHWSHYPTPVTL